MINLSDEKNSISIRRMTRGSLPSVPFALMKNAILGKKYELSILFPTRALATELHKKWKGKNDPVNILSFPLDINSGEIILSIEQARKEAKNYELSYEDYLGFLLIHGMVHLKGYDHGTKMEQLEKKFCKKFGYKHPVYR